MRWCWPAAPRRSRSPFPESWCGGCAGASLPGMFRHAPSCSAELRAARIEPVAEAFYRDHHAYSEQDVRELLHLKQRSEAGGFVTTEKDAVNLGPYLAALGPLSVVPVRMELADAANAVDTVLRQIAER